MLMYLIEYRAFISEKADVYSFATIIWVLLWQDFGNLSDTEQTEQGIHPAIPDDCSDHLREVLEKCWKADPDDRPTLRELIDSHLLHEVNNESIARQTNAYVGSTRYCVWRTQPVVSTGNLETIDVNQRNYSGESSTRQRLLIFLTIAFRDWKRFRSWNSSKSCDSLPIYLLQSYRGYLSWNHSKVYLVRHATCLSYFYKTLTLRSEQERSYLNWKLCTDGKLFWPRWRSLYAPHCRCRQTTVRVHNSSSATSSNTF